MADDEAQRRQWLGALTRMLFYIQVGAPLIGEPRWDKYQAAYRVESMSMEDMYAVGDEIAAALILAGKLEIALEALTTVDEDNDVAGKKLRESERLAAVSAYQRAKSAALVKLETQ